MLHSVSICASAHTCFCMAAHLHMQTTAPASARAHRCAGMCAGGQDSHAQPCFLLLPAWPSTWWYRSAAGEEGCSSITRTPCYGSMRAFVLGNGGVPMHASMCGHVCGDAALLHTRSPEPQGVMRQLEEAWLQAGRAKGRQGAGCWGETKQ